MQVSNFLSPRRTLCGAACGSKKRALELIANTLASEDHILSADDIFTSLTARERLGSTGLGGGIAIPHCRISNCASISGVLLSLPKAIDFESADDQPVDIVFALIVPEEAHDQHLQTLAVLAEKLTQPDYLKKLRSCTNSEELFQAAIS
jgi:PTS system nitrogen regulatory IIA component